MAQGELGRREILVYIETYIGNENLNHAGVSKNSAKDSFHWYVVSMNNLRKWKDASGVEELTGNSIGKDGLERDSS